MTSVVTKCAVLFADIAGSTRLYDQFGDGRAQDVISRCLELMSAVCRDHYGKVIKTVGDEVMCRFPTADDAVRAACEMHGRMKSCRIDASVTPEIRVGLHFGNAIEESGDLFGDAVNLASRMTSIAKAGQTITTVQTIERLSPDLVSSTRLFDKAPVRGKSGDIAMYEVMWEKEDLTHIMSRTAPGERERVSRIKLRHRGREIEILPGIPAYVMGRDPHCDLVVKSSLASRTHAIIESRRGKFVLIDQSTNGTFVRTQDGRDVYLRREELPLWGGGIVSLGQEIDTRDQDVIYYLCE